MGTTKKTIIAAMLGTMCLMTPALADAHWRRYRPAYVHRHHHFPPALIGLGIASAVIGTAAVVHSTVHSIVHPPFLVAAPPPPPPPSYYDQGYRRGYDDARRDHYDRRYDDRYGD